MTTALVFAGHSFVGKPLRLALLRAGVRTVVTARAPTPHVDTVACDLTDRDTVERLVEQEQPDWVIQCAGATRTSDPWQLYGLHVGGTLAVLSAVAHHAPRATVLLFGSAAEYGPVPPEYFPIREDQAPAPATLFAAAKLAQTHLAGSFAAERELRVLTVRPFNIIGPGLPDHYFAAALARRLLAGRQAGGPMTFPVANLHATRDFVDVRDVADAVVALLGTPPAAGRMEVYNIATGVETPLVVMAAELGRLAGGWVPVAGADSRSRGGAGRSCGDSGRLGHATGWTPRHSWQQSVADLWAELGSSSM